MDVELRYGILVDCVFGFMKRLERKKKENNNIFYTDSPYTSSMKDTQLELETFLLYFLHFDGDSPFFHGSATYRVLYECLERKIDII